MKTKLISTASLALVTMTVAACQADGSSDAPAAGLCRSDAASALSGSGRVTDDEAMRITGATIVRQIAPGQGVTMDLRQERVTVETDPKTGKIVRAFCG